jgi:uncharacterized protein with GYD domain
VKVLLKVNYTTDGAKGVLKEGGSGRQEAARQLLESVGGSIESFYFAFGDTDVFVIADVPDNEAIVKASLAVSAAGGARVSTTVLMTPEEFDAAVARDAQYRPPGA